MKEVEAAARSLRIRLQQVEARGPEEFDGAFAAMARERADALLVAGSSTFLAHRARIAELAVKGRLPTMYSFREMVEAGGLMAYAVNMADFVGRAAVYVDKILKGAKPADLARRATDEIRAGDQSQDREGARDSRFRRRCCCARTR